MATIDDVLANEDGTDFAIALSNLVFERCDRDGFEALTPAERVAYCVDALEREVANGGFEQFFSNSSGDTAMETVAALEEIGAAQAAALTRQAIAVIPGGNPPRDREKRCELLDTVGEDGRNEWSELSSRFWEYPDDLTSLMRKYVVAHRAGFRPSP